MQKNAERAVKKTKMQNKIAKGMEKIKFSIEVLHEAGGSPLEHGRVQDNRGGM